MYSLLRELLFLLPAETSHHFALNALKLLRQAHLLQPPVAASGREVQAMGLEFPNPIGLAAGLDKNGDYIDALASFGFGFVEIGTVTPRPQPGNPTPRMFRLPEAQGIINRMGFNNKGLDHLLRQVENKHYEGILGINIGKNADTPVEKAVDDYLKGLHAVYDVADYITINISSPNTPGLRSLQYGDELKQLLEPLKQAQAKRADASGRYVPLAVKVAPDLAGEAIQSMAEVFLNTQMDALIATNTTLSREAVKGLPHADEAGGLSGAPVTQVSTDVIAQFHQQLQGELPIIGVGGIMSAADAQLKLQSGASLLQIYSGFIFSGPDLIKACIKATL